MMKSACDSDRRLTVVLPTYNHGHLIGNALDSLMNQRKAPERVIVIDDGSTDRTGAIVQRYREAWSRIELVTHEENRGVIASLNEALRIVDSEFVTFLAADDFVHSDLYERALSMLVQHEQAALCGVQVQMVDDARRPLDIAIDVDLHGAARYLTPAEVFGKLMTTGRLFHGNGTVYRTAALHEAGGFSPALASFCDGYVIQRLGLKSGVCFVPEILAYWNCHAGGYAGSTQRDPSACWKILHEVLRRVSQEDADIFPLPYRERLIRRLRYMVAAAVGSGPGLDSPQGAGLLREMQPYERQLMRLAARSGGRWGLLAAAALLLRPWDILPGVRRRLGGVLRLARGPKPNIDIPKSLQQ